VSDAARRAGSLRVADLAGRRVVIWGLGREAAAAARAALRTDARAVVAVVDAAPSPGELEAWTAGGLGAVPVRGLDELDTAEVVLLSPGVSRYRPEVDALLDRGVPVTGGTQLFLAEQGARTVVVTGSKGKSTVTRLTAHLLEAVGREAVAAGNIGTALLDLLPGLPADPDVGPLVVAEVSSYQAALVTSPARAAVLTSLFPDHLPWHGGLERYYGDKLRLFAAGPATRLVNGADPNVAALLDEPALEGADVYAAPGSRVRVRGEGPDAAVVVVAGVPVLALRGSRLPGAHNRVNVAAAVAVLDALGVEVGAETSRLEAALARFAPLPHRLEPVGTVGGVTFVDDTLATTAQAAVAACEAYPDRALTLLAGGLDRGIDYEPLIAHLRARARRTPLTVVAMGPAGGRIVAALPGVQVERTDDVADAVRRAAKLTPPGGVVLFSPAAPSPAEYGSYERRSAAFATAVRELSARTPDS
jgi:UDP-N-acetylmuramoylalanine--D-glutamate ligase